MPDRIVPKSTSEDSDDVLVALETARALEERDDLKESARWLQKAAGEARKQGRPERAGELARTAAQLDGTGGKFEKRPDQAQVLSDIDDDEFADETIVDSAAKLKQAGTKPDKIVPGGTPLAPGAAPSALPVHSGLRVAVKKSLGGKLEARPLATGEAAGAGEDEALLVPLSAGTKLL